MLFIVAVALAVVIQSCVRKDGVWYNFTITSKNGRNDAKRLNINVVTVTNDDKMKKRKTQ